MVDLYSDDGSVELIFTEKNYNASAGVTQPEINRIIHSLRKTFWGRVLGYFTNFANLLGSMAMNTARPRANTSPF